MSTRNAIRPLRVRDVEGVVGGGLFGALLAGGLMNLAAYDLIMQFAGMVGSSSHSVAWFVLFGLGVVFAAGFGPFVRATLDPFARTAAALGRRLPTVRERLDPVLQWSPTGVACFALGQGYGFAIGVAHVLLVPLWLNAVVGVSAPLPTLGHLGLVAIVGWVVYGSMMGLAFGLIVES